MTVEQEIADVFASAGARGYLHVREVDGIDPSEIVVDADEPVVAASVFKIPVLVELTRRWAEGGLDPTARVRVPADRRTLGPTGLSVLLDDVEMSQRDLAVSMMSVSDNTATDVLLEVLGGVEPVNATMAALGLDRTVLVGDCDVLLSTLLEDIGHPAGEPIPPYGRIPRERLDACRSLQAAQTNRTTPRDTTTLLSMIWNDEAGPPEACAEMRRILALQVWPHRLTSGFDETDLVAAKTGTLPGIRNEAGVVVREDGRRFAVAVFTVADDYDVRRPRIDAAIGTTARMAVDTLILRHPAG